MEIQTPIPIEAVQQIEPKMCITGIEGLDEYIGEFPCRGLIVVLGHPGGGKTTLVSQLVYNNAIKLGRKALFISLYETKDVLIKNLKTLGIDFEDLESRGLLKLISIPTVSSSEVLDQLVALISDSIATFDPDIIVIDGISAFLESLESTRARAFLHSILYRIAHVNKKLIVAVADLPWGEETVRLGGIEFIADAVFLVKTRIEQRRLMRFLEIRKFRGKQTPIAEIPFAITPSMGIRVLIPLKMEYRGTRGENINLSLLCTPMNVGKHAPILIPQGTQILVLHDHGTEIPRIFIAALAKVAIIHRVKFVVITFSEPIEGLQQALNTLYEKLGIPREEAEKYVKVYGVNPTETWVYGSRLNEFRIIEIEKPQLVALVGIQTIREITDDSEFVSSQVNDVLKYKSMGITVFRFHAVTPSSYIPTAEYSDVVLKLSIQYSNNNPVIVMEMIKTFQPLKLMPTRRTIPLERVYECVFEPIEKTVGSAH